MSAFGTMDDGRWTTRGRWLALVLVVLFTASCDETIIDPFDNDGRIYTIYGFLEQDFEDLGQVVRVIPVTRIPEVITEPDDPRANFDGFVTSTDLRTGRVHVWQHALERLDDGTYGHIFRTSLFVEPNRRDRLEVMRSDGKMAWAETTVPSPVGVELDLSAPKVDAEGAITQEVVLRNVPSPWDITPIYHVGSEFSSTPIRVPYGRVGEPTEDGGWRFTLHISRDRAQIAGGGSVSATRFFAMGLLVRLLDDQWTPPEGVFDPEVLAQPGALSNVENGYGFWGAVGLYQHDWQVAPELRALLGY